MARADLREQGLAFLTGGGVFAEVHVLDHQVDRLRLEQGQPFGRTLRLQGVDVVQGEQHVQCGAHTGVVVDDQDCRHHMVLQKGMGGADGAVRVHVPGEPGATHQA